jgi:tetratricopeptide (TPR) repeat protein
MTELSNDHDTALAQLSALLDRRRFASARDVLAKVLPKYPDSPSLLQYAAWIDWMEDHLDEALATVQRILEIEPDSFDARFLLARIRTEQEQYAEAEGLVIALLKDYPEEPALYAFYGRLMLQTFNVDKAERLAAEALRRDPDHADALNVHVLCGFINSPGSEQRERLHKLLQEHPDQTESTIRLVQLLIDEGKTREAYQLARELVRLHPGNESIVQMATALRHSSHWSLLPLWPMQKWGWAGSVGIWLAVVALLRSDILVETPLEAYQTAIALVFLGYVVYSWVWPPVLKRILG